MGKYRKDVKISQCQHLKYSYMAINDCFFNFKRHIQAIKQNTSYLNIKHIAPIKLQT